MDLGDIKDIDELKLCPFSCENSDNTKAGYATCYTQNIIYYKKHKKEIKAHYA